jgi:hypothetical protein
LGCKVSYVENKDIEKKLNKFRYFCGTLKHTLDMKIWKEIMLKFHKIMTIPSLLYVVKNWTLKGEQLRWI